MRFLLQLNHQNLLIFALGNILDYKNILCHFPSYLKQTDKKLVNYKISQFMKLTGTVGVAQYVQQLID